MLPKENFIQKLNFATSHTKLFLVILIVALLGGVGTGYFLSSSAGKTASPLAINQAPKSAQQDTKTFRDFAQGKLVKKPDPKKGESYTDGTHLLQRDAGVAVALTSSVVDLAQYEGKKVKVYGETQKAIKEGWLMDVGKVEEVK